MGIKSYLVYLSYLQLKLELMVRVPPTIAKHNQPEPLLVSGPSLSIATEKIVGNMIELNKPIASTEYKATSPWVKIVVNNNAITQQALNAIALEGAIFCSKAEPIKRPTIAPPQ